METTKRQTLSVSEVADLIGVSRGLIHKMATEGKLPCIRIGRRILITRATVEEMLGHPLPKD